MNRFMYEAERTGKCYYNGTDMNDRYSEVDLILTEVCLIPVSFNGSLYIKWCQLKKIRCHYVISAYNVL